MLIDRNIAKYIVFAEDSILNALQKISDNKCRIIFSVTESGVLEGVMTDGDFRRWLTNQNTIDLNQSVCKISNKKLKSASVEDEPEKIQSYFSSEIEFIPLLDKNHHLVAIARKRPDVFQIGKFKIDEESPSFIIAEIGNNHNGSLELAKKLIDLAVETGVDCVKFQLRSMKALYRNAGNANDASEDLGSQYTLDLLSRFQLSSEQMLSVFDYCKQRDILPLCTPWDLESLALLEEYGMQAYKVASADLTNHELLTALAKTGKPLICSTGMSTETEISEAVSLLKRLGAMYMLLHCNSTYPAPFKDVNLNYLERLKEIGDCPVGYSGHERDINVAIAAVAKGAKVIEKHFTIDKSMEGNDHKVSLLPEEFQAMVRGIRQVEEALGTASERKLSQGELMNRETLAKSLTINCDLEAGQVITAEMIEVKSPGKGLQPNRKADLIGLKAKRTFKTGDFFFLSDLEQEQVQARNYQFKHPWGVPVRYHDFKIILTKTNPDLFEFHLSYKDLEEDIYQYFEQPYDLDLVVHSPELFAGDHVLDLSSQDEEYRQHSIRELQRVINITRALKPFFTKTTRPCIVTNVGGFTLDAPLHPSQRNKLYELLFDSLSALDVEGVEIIPQTMPPFPWHFGGQRYHNLFVDPQDTTEFCHKHGYRICLDISHSKLACNHHKLSFKQFIEQVGPLTAHLHIADSKGVDGEGLQIGEGDIDFPALAEYLQKTAPNASFIPEIWQGHKNEGEGFWIALEKLEKLFNAV
ncbi:acetylneuraminic acid synthetase [Dulcicalothrix desertica PCC 7102]|uniref:Acetylneuraminic acid synthetase n=1 Tax=Dulcicalothrix desertica PCC 7102 TaxID=232991 RepID=A0A3S1CBH7_9CYAN|nr:N-acetylneuraminate synthase family protein [Dulcicalothrix desertica]RUT00234.1 acetylneuraminic acid synthetase [Dulcicalothrix desertica PCC 7102]TWH55701.1 N-acetylneuraminate synthase [Dulcicalothrix desertica PCC 7102]